MNDVVLIQLLTELKNEITKNEHMEDQIYTFLTTRSDWTKELTHSIEAPIEKVDSKHKDEWLQRAKDALNWAKSIKLPIDESTFFQLYKENDDRKYIEIKYYEIPQTQFTVRVRKCYRFQVYNYDRPDDIIIYNGEGAHTIRYLLFEHAMRHDMSRVKARLCDKSSCIIL